MRTVHAERNAIAQADQHGIASLAGATCYTTLSPCPECLDALVSRGVTRIVYGQEYRLTSHLQAARDAGVIVEHFRSSP